MSHLKFVHRELIYFLSSSDIFCIKHKLRVAICESIILLFVFEYLYPNNCICIWVFVSLSLYLYVNIGILIFVFVCEYFYPYLSRPPITEIIGHSEPEQGWTAEEDVRCDEKDHCSESEWTGTDQKIQGLPRRRKYVEKGNMTGYCLSWLVAFMTLNQVEKQRNVYVGYYWKQSLPLPSLTLRTPMWAKV